MQNVPKIVLKRLQSPAAEAHPDADLLTAFAEQSLASQERGQVLDHLARCGDCREALALALPAPIDLPTPAVSPANWLRWPVLRWAAVAAGVILIASIGILQYRERPKELASNVFDQKQATPTPASSPQPSLPAAVPQTRDRKEASPVPHTQAASAGNKLALPENRMLNGRTFAAGSIHGASTGASIGGPMRPDSAPRRDFNFAPAPRAAASAPAAAQNPAPGPGNQVVEASGASQAVEVQAQATTINVQHSNEVVEVQPLSADQQEAVDKAKPASPQTSLSTLAPAPSLHADPGLLKGPAAPRWTISATGALQRSLDGGKTWLDVNLASVETMTSNFMRPAQGGTNAEVTVESQTAARSAAPAGAKSRRMQSAPAAAPIFHALSVSDNPSEVWAGGSGAVLYHTVDAGNRWTRIIPSAAGSVLTGDVISIQFSDARTGTVTTSTSEVWTTSDDGQTWHKQQ